MTLLQEWITICWVIFVLFWLFNAFNTKTTKENEPLSFRLLYVIPLFVGAVLVFHDFDTSATYPWGLATTITPSTAGFVWLGFLFVLGGLLLALWARVSLGRNWSGRVMLKEGHELVTSGPYAWVRHPIYTAFLAMFLGTAMQSGALGAYLGVVLVFISCWIKLKREERLMLKEFPDTYPAYAVRVKRLIPFVI